MKRVNAYRYCGLFAICLFAGVATHAYAQEARPTRGLIYDPERASSLSYLCIPGNGNVLQCIMFQSTLRKRFSEAGVAAELAKQRANFKPGFALPAESCQRYSNDLDYLEGRKPTTTDELLAAETPANKKFYRDLFAAWVDFCKQPTADTWVRTYEVERAKQLRSCRITQRSYSQSFHWIKGPTLQRSAWVADQEKDTGDSCGFIDLSRFEVDVKSGEKTAANGKLEWKYVARREISNPKGALAHDLPCGLMDTTEYTFTKKEGEFPMQCDFVEYSPL